MNENKEEFYKAIMKKAKERDQEVLEEWLDAFENICWNWSPRICLGNRFHQPGTWETGFPH